MASWISKAMRIKIYKRDQMTCAYCNQDCIICDTRNALNPMIAATLDHIVPQKVLAASATDDKHLSELRRDPKNLVVVCMSCNSSKCHTELYTWCMQTGKNYAIIIAEISRRISIKV